MAEIDDEEAEKLTREAFRDSGRHRKLDIKRAAQEEIDAEQEAAYYRQRYGRRAYVTNEFQDAPQRLLVPNKTDPSLFLVKCKVCTCPGHQVNLTLSR